MGQGTKDYLPYLYCVRCAIVIRAIPCVGRQKMEHSQSKKKYDKRRRLNRVGREGTPRAPAGAVPSASMAVGAPHTLS